MRGPGERCFAGTGDKCGVCRHAGAGAGAPGGVSSAEVVAANGVWANGPGDRVDEHPGATGPVAGDGLYVSARGSRSGAARGVGALTPGKSRLFKRAATSTLGGSYAENLHYF